MSIEQVLKLRRARGRQLSHVRQISGLSRWKTRIKYWGRKNYTWI